MLFHLDQRKSKKFIEDKRMTSVEKKIHRAWFLLRDSKLDDLLDLCLELVSDDPFVESQRDLILGLCYNNRSEYSLSLKYLESALKKLQLFEAPFFEFMITYNLTIVTFNLKSKKKFDQYVQSLGELKAQTFNQEVCHLDAAFTQALWNKDLAEQEKILVQMERLKEKMSEPALMCHLFNKFQFYLQEKKYPMCRKVLEELKGSRKFHFSANYEFMKTLLDYLELDRPLYIFETKFKKYPELYHQLKVISALDASHLQEAQRFWQKLEAQNPELYQKDFFYNGDPCLFSWGLEKNQKNMKAQNSVTVMLTTEQSKEDILLGILEAEGVPVPKEKLFRMLYGHDPLSASDDGKLQKLASRLRLKRNVEIKTKKGAFYLKKAS